MTSRLPPRCMSTQHPDNVRSPFFAQESVFQEEEEVDEALYVFRDLGMDEQMWDYEGKEVDSNVVRKLLLKDSAFFQDHVLGQDVFLTFRVPNPRVEQGEGKWLLETLRSVPRSYDVAREFYKRGITPPVFEVILPMTTSARELERVFQYYRQQVAGEEELVLLPGDMTVAKWVGPFEPKTLGVIPLIEDIPNLLGCDRIVQEFLENHPEIPSQRVFLARSDPALNYGYASAFLAVEIALLKLHRLEKRLDKPIYPILGPGTVPFRGNLKPTNVSNCLQSYPSVQTFTLQSAFKYDYPEEVVQAAVREIRAFPRGCPREVDEKESAGLITRLSAAYQQDVVKCLATLSNGLAPYIPPRRKRKLHIGLYGYARGFGTVSLPRAITYCAALYSIGIPPEVAGLADLTPEDWAYLNQDGNFTRDLKDALAFVHEDILLEFLPEARAVLDRVDYESSPEHKKLARTIYQAAKDGLKPSLIQEMVVEAAALRGFLG